MKPEEAKDYLSEGVESGKELFLKIMPDYVDAMNLALESLEKQIPMKPKPKKVGKLIVYENCPSCGRKAIKDHNGYCYKFCGYCGQKLDWRI